MNIITQSEVEGYYELEENYSNIEWMIDDTLFDNESKFKNCITVMTKKSDTKQYFVPIPHKEGFFFDFIEPEFEEHRRTQIGENYLEYFTGELRVGGLYPHWISPIGGAARQMKEKNAKRVVEALKLKIRAADAALPSDIPQPSENVKETSEPESSDMRQPFDEYVDVDRISPVLQKAKRDWMKMALDDIRAETDYSWV